MPVTHAPAITVENVCKSYGATRAVDHLNFDTWPGEVFGLLGPNGAGKTTSIEMIIGLRRRDSGEIQVLGLDPQRHPRRVKARIGVQLQTAYLYPHLTVREVVGLFASFFRRHLPVDQIVEQVGLSPKVNTRVKDLSGGQLQRLAIATALINDGDLIFLDEPTTGLDPQARRSLWDIIIEMKQAGKTVLLTTHYMDEAERLCDRVAIIDYGRIIASGSPQELVASNFQEKALEFFQPQLAADVNLRKALGVTRMEVDDSLVTIYTTEVAQTIAELMKMAAARGMAINDIAVRGASLEDVFLKYTGRRLNN